MNTINSVGTLKKTCEYMIDFRTVKTFKCSGVQNCCGTECCDDDGLLDRQIIWFGGALLLVVLVVSFLCWYIIRSRRTVLKRDKQQRVTNMVAAAPQSKDCIVQIKVDCGGNRNNTKAGILQRNLSFPGLVLPMLNTKLEKYTAGSHDKQPLLLENSHGEEPPSPSTGPDKIMTDAHNQQQLLFNCSQ